LERIKAVRFKRRSLRNLQNSRYITRKMAVWTKIIVHLPIPRHAPQCYFDRGSSNRWRAYIKVK
jgi:hypothetical protein